MEREGRVEEKVEATSIDTGGGCGADSTNCKREIGETVQEGNTPSPPNRGPAKGRRPQKRATWAEVVAAGGVNIPAVFNLLGLPLGNDGKGVYRRTRNRHRPDTRKGSGASQEAPHGGTESGGGR
jgi:hypothetical protein